MLISSLRGMKNLGTIAHIVLATMLVLRMPSQVAGAWFLDGTDSREQNAARKFNCNNGRYVEPEAMCDGIDNCENNEDENVCSPERFVCPTGSFTCRNKMRCMPMRRVCDGDNDCKDAVDGVSSDEKDCPTSTEVTTTAATTPELTTRITTPLVTAASEATSSNPTSPSMRLCDVDDGGFPCMDGRCLLPVQVCDGVRDCSNGADEGRFCQLVRRGNQQPPLQPQQQPQRQSQRQPYQQPQQHHGLRGWLVDLRMQFRMLFQPLHDSSNLTSRE